MRRILCLALAVLCLGCTKLVSHKVTDTSENVGFSYNLKRIGFIGNVTHVLKSCDPVPKVAVSAELAPVFRPDWDAEYRINYDEWTKINKSFDFKLEIDEFGSIQSINTSAEDKTLEIATKVLTTAATIAAGAAGLPFVPLSPPVQIEGEVMKKEIPSLEPIKLATLCKQETKDTLAKISELKKQITQQNQSILGNEKEIAAKLELASKQASNSNRQKQYIRQVEILREANQQLADLVAVEKNQAAKLMEGLTLVSKVSLGYFDTTTQVEWKPDADALKDWFLFINSGDLPKWTVHAQLSRVNPARIGELKPSVEGVYYRRPGEGLLSVCSGGVCGKDGALELHRSLVAVPQFGSINILPFNNGFGETNKVGVSFTATGGLDTAQYSTTAGDAKLGGMLDKASSVAGGMAAAVKNKKLDEIEAETKLYTAQAERAKAKKALKDAEDALKNLEN